MNREQLNSNFFPSEIMLKLFRDIPDSEVGAKIKLVNEYIEEVQDSYDAEVLKVIQHNQIAHIYWVSEQHSLSISHFEVVVENMEPEDSPSKYFQAINLLVRGNRLLFNYQEAEKWIALAFGNSEIFHPFENLINLNDYADLIADSGKAFNENYSPLIQSIIDELGFPEKLDDPVDTIRSMNKRHKIWSRKMGDLTLAYAKSDTVDAFEDLEEYIESCEIEWYGNYARKMLDKLKSK